MSQGRCAGCGEVGKVPVVREHVRYCRDYARLHASKPDQALDPADEFERWKDEQRDAERAVSRQAAVTEADRRRAEQQGRWVTPPDILGDDDVLPEFKDWLDSLEPSTREAKDTAGEITDEHRN